MSWMIREDQLNPDQIDFINHVSSSSNNYLLVNNSCSNSVSIQTIVWIIKKVKEKEIIIIFPNYLLLTMCREELDSYFLEISLKGKNVQFDLFPTDKSAQLYIYFFPHWTLQNKLEKEERHIVFTNDNIEIPNFKKYNNNSSHHFRKSLIQLAKLLDENDEKIFYPKNETTKIDASINCTKFKDVNDELLFIVKETQEIHRVADDSLILFPNKLFSFRFVSHLLDYAFFDLAEEDFEDIEIEKFNKLLAFYDLPYIMVDSNSQYHKIEIHKKIVLATYNTALFFIHFPKNVFFPFANRVASGKNRVKEIANILKGNEIDRLYVTCSNESTIPNNFMQIFEVNNYNQIKN